MVQEVAMMHEPRLASLLLSILVLLPLAASAQKPDAVPSLLKPPKLSEKDLPQKYQEFIKIASYIITEKEKDVFLQLTNDRDRDVFIESFWKIRDPTPGTPENEYKIEHVRRFEYANTILGRSAGRPGWMTDKGRCYIILGEPVSKDRFDAEPGLRPVEVWYYYSDGKKGLPLRFGLVFFQKAGVGESKLYDPYVDGPRALLTATAGVQTIDPDDYEALYGRLREIAPSLADIAFSLIPGEYGLNDRPTPRNTQLLADILDSPKADIRPAYAAHFLEYKGIVSTEYMPNFVESDAVVAIFADPAMETPFVHFSIRPASASADYFATKDQYYCSFSVSVSLRTTSPAPEAVVFQYTREFPFYFAAADAGKVRSNGIAVEDAFPVAPGKYKMTVLLQNAVGKEFSLFEKTLDIPASDPAPRLVGPVFGYRSQDSPANLYAPFKIGNRKMLLDPRNTFGREDTVVYALSVENVPEALRSQGALQVEIRGASGKPEGRKSLLFKLRDCPAGRDVPILQTLPAKDLPPDYYELEATLIDAGSQPLASAKGQFILSSADKMGHPIPDIRPVAEGNRYLYFGMLAQQAAGLDDPAKADDYYRKAFELKPNFTRGLDEYAAFLLKTKQYERCLEVAEKFRADGALQFDYLAVRGKALAGQGRFAEAADALLRAARVYNSDTSVLNALGRCYLKLQKKREAVEALQASLKLDPGQDEAKKLLAEAEKTLK